MTDTELKELMSKLNLHPSFGERRVMEELQAAGVPSSEFVVSSGATKLCLAFKNVPYVLKWGRDETEDAALQEINLYAYALAEGLGAFFPKTEFFCMVNGVPLVKQQRVGKSVHDIWDDPKLERKLLRLRPNTPLKPMDKCTLYRIDDSLECNVRTSLLWSLAALITYGRNKCEMLCEFLASNHINDLHERNIGFVGMLPVILDFGGFY